MASTAHAWERFAVRASGLASGLGHASIITTLGLYGHLYPGEMDRCLNEAARMSDAADDAAK